MQEIVYREEIEVSKVYKEAYLNGIKNLIAQREQSAVFKRDQFCKDIFSDTSKYRDVFKECKLRAVEQRTKRRTCLENQA